MKSPESDGFAGEAGAAEGGWVVVDCRQVRFPPPAGRQEASRAPLSHPRPVAPAARAPMGFDDGLVADAVARITRAAGFVTGLGGAMPGDPQAWSELRGQVEELSRGLIVLTALADELRHRHDRASARWDAALLGPTLACDTGAAPPAKGRSAA